MINEKLKNVSRTDTAIQISKYLVTRERMSADTTLDTFRTFLLRNNYSVKKEEFYKYFQELDSSEIGKIIAFKGKPLGKFIWKYTFRSVASQILNPQERIELIPVPETLQDAAIDTAGRSRGRPVGFSPKAVTPKPQIITSSMPVVSSPMTSRSIEPNTMLLFTTSSGELLPLSLKDAEQIAEYVSKLKQLGKVVINNS